VALKRNGWDRSGLAAVRFDDEARPIGWLEWDRRCDVSDGEWLACTSVVCWGEALWKITPAPYTKPTNEKNEICWSKR
jgi:hypothetical protein